MNMKIFLLNYLQNYYFYEIFLNFNYSREGKTRCKIKSIPLPKKNNYLNDEKRKEVIANNV
jgi:hypothetical protein